MKYDIPIGINEQQHSQLSFYPNPASNKLTIKTYVNGSLSIDNLYGQRLLHQEITKPTTTVDISTLLGGVYFAMLVVEKTVQIGKFIKN